MVHSPPETHKLPPPTRHIPATALTLEIGATHSAGTQNSSAPAPAETSRDGVPPETLDLTEDGKLNRLFRPVFDFRRKHPSNFIFAHVNVNSLRHKFASLHEILSKNCLDYFAISETKLDASFPDAQFNVNDFNILREDNTAASGGLMVYIRSDIPHRRLTAAEYNKDGIETICIEVLLGKTKTVIACIYKHPRVKNDLFKSAFSFISDQLFRNCTDTIFIGDMNCDPNKNNVIKDICDTYNLCNLIKDPTCHKADVSTLLDVVLV